MFDVFLALLFARVVAISAWRRFPAGLFASGAGALLWVGLAASGWYGRGADALAMTGVWVLVFFGPSVVPAPTPRVPWSALLAAHPVGAKLAMAALFAVPFALSWHRAQAGSPLGDEVSARKKLALVYLVPALLLVAQVVCLELTMVAAPRM